MALAGVRKAITEMLGVASVHELHLWTTGADQAVCTVHVVLADGAVGEDVRKAIAARLETDFDLHHVTIQTRCGVRGGRSARLGGRLNERKARPRSGARQDFSE